MVTDGGVRTKEVNGAGGEEEVEQGQRLLPRQTAEELQFAVSVHSDCSCAASLSLMAWGRTPGHQEDEYFLSGEDARESRYAAQQVG